MFSRRLRLVLLALLLGAVGVFGYAVRAVLPPFLAALIVAYVLSPLVNALEKKGAPRWAGTLVVYLGLGLMVAAVLAFAVPSVVSELEGLSRVLPGRALELRSAVERVFEPYRTLRVPAVVRTAVENAISRAEAFVTRGAVAVVEWVLGLVQRVFSIAIIPVLAFYISKDAELLKSRALSIVPPAWRPDAAALAHDVDVALSGFVRGQLILASIVGVATGLLLAVLGVQFAALIGVVVGLVDLVPYFGPVLGFVPAVLAASQKSGWTVAWTAVGFVAIQQLESGVIGPKILGDRVGLHPLAVIFALLAGGRLFGVWGLLLAVPSAAVIRVAGRFALERLACAVAEAPPSGPAVRDRVEGGDEGAD